MRDKDKDKDKDKDNDKTSLTRRLRDVYIGSRKLEGEAGAEGSAEGIREDGSMVGVEAVEEGEVHGAAG